MNLEKYIGEIENFPKEGIVFKDISPLLKNPEAFNFIIEEFANKVEDATKILALDARGFIFGGALALKTNIPLVMARKPGKLPGETLNISYDLEYGSNSLEIQKNAFNTDDKVFIIDDLLATGGTAKASIDLIEKIGATVASVNFVIELESLGGRKLLEKYDINSLVKYK